MKRATFALRLLAVAIAGALPSACAGSGVASSDDFVVPDTDVGDADALSDAGGGSDALDTDAEADLDLASVAGIETTLDVALAAAGTTVNATCTAADSAGSPVELPAAVFSVEVSPEVGVSVDGLALSPTEVGFYDVSCVLAAAGIRDETPALLEVQAAAPVALELALDPDLGHYDVDQPIAVTGVGHDAWENPVGDIALTALTAQPAGHLTVADSEVSFDGEGVFTVSASAVDFPDLQASRAITVDQSPPDIDITAPPRGAVVEGGPTVTVEGTVTDAVAVAALQIDGEPVQIGDEGAFSTTVFLSHGLNPIVVTASDPFEHVATATRSVALSEGFYPLIDPTIDTDGVGEGLVVMLGPDAIDDGDPMTYRDLAAVMAVWLDAFDLSALLPASRLMVCPAGKACALHRGTITAADSAISLTLIDGGVSVVASWSGITADLQLDAPCSDAAACASDPMSIEGTLTAASLTVTADLQFALNDGLITGSTAAGDVQIELTDPAVLLVDPTGVLGAEVAAAGATYETGFTAGAEDVLPAAIEDALTALFGNLAAALAAPRDFDIDSMIEGVEPNHLVLESAPTRLELAPTHLTIGYDVVARTTADAAPPHGEVPGSLRYDSGCGEVAPAPEPPDAATRIALHDDAINQLLFGIWAGGSLLANAGAEAPLRFDTTPFGLDLDTMVLDASLPPVLISCADESVIQLGDVLLELHGTWQGAPLDLVLWLQLTADLDLSADFTADGRAQLRFGLGAVESQIIEIAENKGPFAGDPAGLDEAIGDALLPAMLDRIELGLTFGLTTATGPVLAPRVETFSRTGPYLVADGPMVEGPAEQQ